MNNYVNNIETRKEEYRKGHVPIINYLLGQDDQQPPEDPDKVNEKIQRVSYKVLASHPALLDDQLRVIEDKSTHRHQPQVELRLVDPGGS